MPGTVLISPGGGFRVIRQVTKGSNIRHPIFSFAIRRCSWTRRPSTCYTWGELVRAGYVAAGVTVALNSRMDRKFERNLGVHAKRTLFCWDVVGSMP